MINTHFYVIKAKLAQANEVCEGNKSGMRNLNVFREKSPTPKVCQDQGGNILKS